MDIETRALLERAEDAIAVYEWKTITDFSGHCYYPCCGSPEFTDLGKMAPHGPENCEMMELLRDIRAHIEKHGV